MSAELGSPLAVVCRVLEAPRSTVYARRAAPAGGGTVAKRGPKCALDEKALLDVIRQVIVATCFAGEGHRKVCARLRREHDVAVGRKRVLKDHASGRPAGTPASERPAPPSCP